VRADISIVATDLYRALSRQCATNETQSFSAKVQ
jgi:hypothetical protein